MGRILTPRLAHRDPKLAHGLRFLFYRSNLEGVGWIQSNQIQGQPPIFGRIQSNIETKRLL